MIQNILVALALAAAGLFLIRRLIRLLRGRALSCGCGCSSCPRQRAPDLSGDPCPKMAPGQPGQPGQPR